MAIKKERRCSAHDGLRPSSSLLAPDPLCLTTAGHYTGSKELLVGISRKKREIDESSRVLILSKQMYGHIHEFWMCEVL